MTTSANISIPTDAIKPPTPTQFDIMSSVSGLVASHFLRLLGRRRISYEDLFQTAYVGCLRGHPTWKADGGKSYKYWLYVRAFGECSHYIRDAAFTIKTRRDSVAVRRQGFPVFESIDSAVSLVNEEGHTKEHPSLIYEEEGFSKVDVRDTVYRFLDTLPPREARILKLYWINEQSQTQIARLEGISQKHVSRILRRKIKTDLWQVGVRRAKDRERRHRTLMSQEESRGAANTHIQAHAGRGRKRH